MPSDSRFPAAFIRTAPTLIIVVFPLLTLTAIVLLLMAGLQNPWQNLDERAAFVDRNEFGEITVLRFVDFVPDPEQLRSLPSLRIVSIEDATVSAAVMAAVADLGELKSISFAGSTVNEQDLQLLTQSVTLTELDLSRTAPLVKGLVPFRLPQLQTLKLNGCSWVDDKLVSSLTQFPELQTLELSNTELTNDGTKRLLELPNLCWLDLSECSRLGDPALAHLAGLPSLQSLTLSGHNLSLAAARKFQDSCPSAQLYVPLKEFKELQPILQSQKELSGPTPQFFSQGLKSLKIHDVTGIDYTGLQYFPELKSLSLSGSAINDDALEFLAQLPQLESLRLNDSAITDAGLKHVAAASQLESLNLSTTAVTDDGMHHLLGLNRLRWLDLSHTSITDAGLQQLTTLVGLTQVHLEGIQLTDRSREILKLLPNLKGVVDLSASRVSRSELAELTGRPFQRVSLAQRSLSANGLDVVKTWSQLTSLDLSQTNVTGEGLDLTGNTRLESLNLSGASLLDSTMTQIKLPQSLRQLSLASSSIHGESLSVLSELKLASLDLSHNPLSEQGVRNALYLHAESLKLAGIHLSGPLSEPVIVNPAIRSLTLHADDTFLLSGIRSSELATRLPTLAVDAARSEHLHPLLGFTQMNELVLTDGTFQKGSFATLAGLQHLTKLRLNNCQLTTEAVHEIARLPYLESLRTIGPALSQQDMDFLIRSNRDRGFDRRLSISGGPFPTFAN